MRVPAHPIAQALLARFVELGGDGIAAPSANRFGRISATTAAHVAEEFGPEVAVILDGGPCDHGIESTIVDCSRGRPVLLRPGVLTRAEEDEQMDAADLPEATYARVLHDLGRVNAVTLAARPTQIASPAIAPPGSTACRSACRR